MMHACSARIIQKKIKKKYRGGGKKRLRRRTGGWLGGCVEEEEGGFNTATPVNSVVRQMKTHQVIRANMALEAARSVEEKLTSRTI